MIYLVTVVAVIWSLRTIDIIPEFLYDAPEQTADLFKRMWPFDWAFYPKAIHAALIETFHIATLGTILAIAMALPLSFLAARNFTRSPILRWVAQFIFVSSRSVNSLIWALLFVAIFGPGALAGVFSIAVRSIGFVGKLFGEALEEARPGPIEALEATGAPRSMILAKATGRRLSRPSGRLPCCAGISTSAKRRARPRGGRGHRGGARCRAEQPLLGSGRAHPRGDLYGGDHHRDRHLLPAQPHNLSRIRRRHPPGGR